jgi:hypothetical protein
MDEEDPAEVANTLHLLQTDSGYGESGVCSTASLSVAKEEFEEELRKRQADTPLEDIWTPLPAESMEPSVRKKSLTDPTRLIKKLFVKNTAMIQAASDGDIKRVAKLLSLGCNVNTTERWGYASCLSVVVFCFLSTYLFLLCLAFSCRY